MELRRGEPTTESAIEYFERAYDVKLPVGYRDFIRDHNGGFPEPNCLPDSPLGPIFVSWIFPLDADVRRRLPFPQPRDSGLLPIATNSGGDYYLLSLETDEIFYWDHEYDDDEVRTGELMSVAPNIRSLLDRLVYPPGEGPRQVGEIEMLGRGGSAQDLQLFLRDSSLQARNSEGRTVAEEAARYGNAAVLRRCVDLGAPLDELLHYATSSGNPETINYLIEKGAGINDLNDLGQSPLDRALTAEAYELIEKHGGVHVKRRKPPHLIRPRS